MKYGIIAMMLGLTLFIGMSANAQSSSKSSSDPVATSASVVVGTVGGTPVAFFRRWMNLDDSGARQWMKQSYFHTDNKLILLPAKFVTLPVAGILAAEEAPFWSFRNALKHSSEKPFGKDSFSLGPSLEGDLY